MLPLSGCRGCEEAWCAHLVCTARTHGLKRLEEREVASTRSCCFRSSRAGKLDEAPLPLRLTLSRAHCAATHFPTPLSINFCACWASSLADRRCKAHWLPACLLLRTRDRPASDQIDSAISNHVRCTSSFRAPDSSLYLRSCSCDSAERRRGR